MTQTQVNVMNLVNAAGVQTAGFAIAEALVLMQQRYGVDLLTVLDGIQSSENGAARFNQLMSLALEVVAAQPAA